MSTAMTRTRSARVAGATFLIYIAAGVAGMAGASGPLVSVALSLLMAFSALVLGVTLYAITCDEGPDIAMLAMTCRVGECVLGAMFMPMTLALRSLESATGAPDAAQVRAFGALFREARGFNVILDATFFAVGSTLFCWLLLRGRMIPAGLAWLGLCASFLLVAGLPLQLAGTLSGPVTQIMWIPMAAFEIPLGLWLLVKGVAMPRNTNPARSCGWKE